MKTYSQLVIELAEGWYVAMKHYDSYQKNNNVKDMNAWFKFLDSRKEIEMQIEELVEKSKLYRDKYGL